MSKHTLRNALVASGLAVAALVGSTSIASASTPAAGIRMIQHIETYDMGRAYVYGGEGDAAHGYGFDCSGLMQVAAETTGTWLPRTSEAQQHYLRNISYNNRQPGDLVFFGYPAYHVGIYIGVRWYNGAWRSMMIDAPHPNTRVRVEPVYYSGAGYVSYGRP